MSFSVNERFFLLRFAEVTGKKESFRLIHVYRPYLFEDCFIEFSSQSLFFCMIRSALRDCPKVGLI